MPDLKNKLYTGRILTVALFTILSIAGFGFAVYLFYVATSPYMYLLAIAFALLAAAAGFFNIYASIWYYRSFFYDEYLGKIRSRLKPMDRYPTVAMIMPMYNEDPAMVEANIRDLKTMNYDKKKLRLYVADDSTDKNIAAEMADLSKKYNFTYVHRDDRRGYKAGALNNVINNYVKEEFIAVFDADEKLVDRNFVLDMLPYFQDEKLCYIQTEKRYMKGNFFSDSIDIFDAFFFRFIQPARAMNNTAVFAGSCGLIRRSAFINIGGFPEYVIEDTFFSFESDMHGWKSLYVPKIYAMGRPIKTFTELSKQQWRYNYGDTQFLTYFFKRKGWKTRKSPLATTTYLAHGFGLNYLSVVLILFTLISVGIVFSTVPFAHINFWQFIETNHIQEDLELLGFFAFSLSLLTPVFLTKVYFKSWSKGLMVFFLNYALAIVRTKAALSTVIKMNPGVHWNRLKTMRENNNKILATLYATRVELAFALCLFGLAYLALAESNIAGGIWLGWFGCLYSLTTVFMHKYG
jgi:cellulose synthase (UDP-forming)